MSRPLTDFRVLTFDCYGTLIDWESGIWDALQPLLADNHREDVTRPDALESFGRLETAQEVSTPNLPYPDVLRRVHRDLASDLGMETDDALDEAFAASVPLWPAFPDTADALRSLHRRFRLVVLSNVDRRSFAASNRKLGVAFDGVHTAEDIGSYKPDRANFDHMLAAVRIGFGIEPGDVLHTAQSVYHDIAPAAGIGLATAWIDRQRLSEGGDWGATAPVGNRPDPDFTFFTLAEMAAAASDA